MAREAVARFFEVPAAALGPDLNRDGLMNRKPPLFSHQTMVRLYHTDAAGIIFYGRLFELVHEAWEAFCEASGVDIGRILDTREFLLPIVHVEADYFLPMRTGTPIRIDLIDARPGNSSVTFEYELRGLRDNALLAKARVVQVAIDGAGRKIPLPEAIRTICTGRPTPG